MVLIHDMDIYLYAYILPGNLNMISVVWIDYYSLVYKRIHIIFPFIRSNIDEQILKYLLPNIVHKHVLNLLSILIKCKNMKDI